MDSILALTFSPDGKTLAAGRAARGFDCWDAATGKRIVRLKDVDGRIESLVISADSQRLATAGSEGLRVWELATRQCIRSTRMRDHKICAVAFSPDSKTLASGGEDGRVRLWEPAGDCDCRSFGKVHCEQVLAISISPDGRTLATASEDATARLWELQTGKPIRSLKKRGEVTCGPLFSVAFSPDGKVLAAGQYRDGITLWDPDTGRQVREIKGHEGRVVGLAYSPDGKTLVSGGHDDKNLHLWETSTGKESAQLKHPFGVGGQVAFSPDGNSIASIWPVSEVSRAALWDRKSRKQLHTWQLRSGLGEIAFSPEGLLLAIADAGRVCIHDADSGQVLFGDETQRRPHPTIGRSGLFSERQILGNRRRRRTAGMGNCHRQGATHLRRPPRFC